MPIQEAWIGTSGVPGASHLFLWGLESWHWIRDRQLEEDAHRHRGDGPECTASRRCWRWHNESRKRTRAETSNQPCLPGRPAGPVERARTVRTVGDTSTAGVLHGIIL